MVEPFHRHYQVHIFFRNVHFGWHLSVIDQRVDACAVPHLRFERAVLRSDFPYKMFLDVVVVKEEAKDLVPR
jgi:hypothetical protein